MKKLLLMALLAIVALPAHAATVYEQPHDGGGTLYQSSSSMNDYDKLVFDAFTLNAPAVITEVRWRGGYMIPPVYPSTKVADFSITFWADVVGGPDIAGKPIAIYEWDTGIGSANETPAGSFGGADMYDYAYVLPVPFIAVSGKKYWIEIAALQGGVPGWAIAGGTGGDNQHWQSFVNYAGGTNYRTYTGDAAFSLLTAGAAPFTSADVATAIGIWSGLATPRPGDTNRLNVETGGASSGVIDGLDVARLARKVAGLDPNP